MDGLRISNGDTEGLDGGELVGTELIAVVNLIGETVERVEEFACVTHCGGATASHLLFRHPKAGLQHDAPLAHT